MRGGGGRGGVEEEKMLFSSPLTLSHSLLFAVVLSSLSLKQEVKRSIPVPIVRTFFDTSFCFLSQI